MGADYSKYLDVISDVPGDVCALYIKSGTIYSIGVPDEILNELLTTFNSFFNTTGIIRPYYNTLKKLKTGKRILYQGAGESHSAKGKTMFCKFHQIFCRHGWSMINSPTLTYEHSLATWFYVKVVNPFMVHSGGVDNEFCAIGLSSYSNLQLLSFPPSLTSGLIDVTRTLWSPKVKDAVPIVGYPDALTIELTGSPWKTCGEDSLNARSLLLGIIRYMSRNNWRLVNSTAMKPDASDTLFFRKYGSFANDSFGDNTGKELPPGEIQDVYFMLALMNPNYFSFIGADENIQNFITNSCSRHEPKGLKPKTVKKNFPAVVFVSDVWSRRNEHDVKTRKLMTLLFQDLASIGWMPSESIDCSRKLRDLSSIAFVRIPPSRMMYFCLAPKKYSGITLINATDEVRDLVFENFRQFYAIKNDDMTIIPFGDGISLEFQGNPYYGNNLFGSMLYFQAINAVISALKSRGWFMVVSADTSNETKTRSKGSDDTETVKWSIYALWFATLL